MLPEDRDLLADLRHVCNAAGVFAVEYLAGALSVEAEEAYAESLIDIGERLLDHVRIRKGLDHNGEPTPLIIDAEFVRVDVDVRELPPGGQPDHRP